MLQRTPEAPRRDKSTSNWFSNWISIHEQALHLLQNSCPAFLRSTFRSVRLARGQSIPVCQSYSLHSKCIFRGKSVGKPGNALVLSIKYALLTAKIAFPFLTKAGREFDRKSRSAGRKMKTLKRKNTGKASSLATKIALEAFCNFHAAVE